MHDWRVVCAILVAYVALTRWILPKFGVAS